MTLPRPSFPPVSSPHARGFTLIEVMVSLFILALMSAMAWQGIDTVMHSREVTQQRMEKLLRLQTSLAQWEADLREVTDTQVVPGTNFDGATMRMTRRQSDGVQVVAWTLRSGALYRWSGPVNNTLDALQESWMRSYQLLGNESNTHKMLEGVSQWQLFVFLMSSNSWSNAQSSGDAVDNTANAAQPPALNASGAGSGVVSNAPPVVANRDALPDGLRVVIQFGENGTASGTLTRETRLVHP